MRKILLVAVAMLLCAKPVTVSAQASQQSKNQKKEKTPKEPKPYEAPPLWDSDELLQLTLTANFKQLKKDKGDNPPWRAATIGYTGAGGAPAKLPLKVRTRGIWRLKNCEMPPLRLNIAKERSKGTIFAKLDKPKLASYCRDNDDYEQYLLQEFQLYRVYALFTPIGHKVRLAHLTYVDSASDKPVTTRYAILEEEPAELASRVGGFLIEQQGAGPDDLDEQHLTLFNVFQYFIGNTDWSIPALHNVELVGKDTAVYPIAYDFDFAGAVNTRYATPDPRLSIKRVRDRLYRGYCGQPALLPPVYAKFNQEKDAIYGLYKDKLGSLLRPQIVRETLSYFDEFYQTISDQRLAKGNIQDQCLVRR